ncbi:MAG: hypothetical protein J6U44_07620, partial [Paludibacteraceae bacterium]|nr:hypothetical protein [Paludibacteraceae bacterium]
MMKNSFLFIAALFAALSLGFVSCENPDDEPGFSLENVEQDDANSDKENEEGSTDGDGTTPSAPEEPMLVATGGATDVEYSRVTLWGRLNTDTLVFFPKVKWGVECSASKEEITTHSGKKKLCTTDLVGENADEFSVELTEVGYGKMLYYNAYLLINDIKYVYGEVDSVHMDVKLTLKTNDSNYGEVTGTVCHDYGSETTITATPKENCYFTGWSDCDSKELTRTVQVNSDTTITAIFSKKPYLTVNRNNSYGTVTGSGYYDVGAEATITATPEENYYFTGWSDCDSKELTRTVQVKSNTTITANFAKKPYLTVKRNNSHGTVTGSGYYEPNTEVTITATPKEYTEFVQWSDGNTENPRTVTITSNVTYVAEFKVSYTSNFTPAAFSVSADKQVYFSPGNLQLIQSSGTWQFASCQLEFIGTDNVTGGKETFDEYGYDCIGTALADKLDLLRWRTSAGSFVDWGTKQIGSDAPNTWRTLTLREWSYVVFSRPNASSLRGVAQVNGVNGLILLPDGWTCPAGITFKSGFHDDYGVDYYAAYQTFTAD